MKKILVVLLIAILAISTVLLISCDKKEEVEELKSEYTIVAPDGAPAIAVSTFIKNTQVTDDYKVSASVVAPNLIKKEAIKSDFAIVPANVAATLFNAGEDCKLVASVTNGNMYILAKEQETNFTLENMKGKMLYTIGQGSVPALILLSILSFSSK